MTRVLPRTNLHSSKLIRCLADLALLDAVEPGTAFAEQLGLWIHFADAISLSALHGDGIPKPQQGQAGRPPERQHALAAAAALERVQASVTDSIARSFSPGTGKALNPLPAPDFTLPLNLAAAYVPYRRFYEAHQRDMDAGIQPLRTRAREALAKTSPRLRKLAELDVALEKILREREGKLLSKVPLLLQKRFEQLYKEHQQKLADAGQADEPAGWTQADGWLARFCNDMQMLLLAEAELRLQPAMGLIEAFGQDKQ